MRQAIVTKYCGPTNTRGSRVKVTADAGTMYVPWDHALDVTANHTAAAKQFAERYGWAGQWCGGALPPKYGGNCYVLIPHYFIEAPNGRDWEYHQTDESNFYIPRSK